MPVYGVILPALPFPLVFSDCTPCALAFLSALLVYHCTTWAHCVPIYIYLFSGLHIVNHFAMCLLLYNYVYRLTMTAPPLRLLMRLQIAVVLPLQLAQNKKEFF